METIGIMFIVLAGINYLPYLLNKDFEILTRKVQRILIPIFTITMMVFILSNFGLKLKGFYWYKILGISSITFSLLYLSIETHIVKKAIVNLALIALFIICTFQSVLYEKTGTYELGNNLKLVVSQEGFLGCGENLRITESKFFIFDKELESIANQCLTGISDIKIVHSSIDQLEIMIEHDERMDSENPYFYKFKHKNDW